jgi:hypothetical protein
MEHNGAMIALRSARSRLAILPARAGDRGRTHAGAAAFALWLACTWTTALCARADELPPTHADALPPPSPSAPANEPASEPPEPSAAPLSDNGNYPPPADYGSAPVTDDAALEALPGAREHEGLFVRLTVGPGAARSLYREQVDGVRTSRVVAAGLSGTFDLAVGGRAVGNLIVHGSAAYARFHAQLRSVDGVKDAAVEVSTTAVTLGVGVTYYFMPHNVLLSGALGPGWLFESRRDGEVRSKTGLYVLAAAGKEWWVGPRGDWGLGTALRFTYAAAGVEIGGVASTLQYMDLALAFCATFN